MSYNKSQASDQQEEQNILNQRPERPSKGRGMPVWLPVAGGIIVLGVLILVAVLFFLRPGTGGTKL